MTHTNVLLPLPVQPALLARKMLFGAAIALIMIGVFLSGVKNPDLAWPKLWMLKPLIMVPLAGAAGGAFYYFISILIRGGGWKTIAMYIISLIGYIFALWLGIVLGLNGTLWN